MDKNYSFLSIDSSIVSYVSRTLNESESRYSITKRELLAAVIFALKQFRQYLLVQHFTMRTDHSPLTHLRSLQDPSIQMGRWLDKIQEYNFSVEHRPGRLHGNADGLSRMHEHCNSFAHTDAQPNTVLTSTEADRKNECQQIKATTVSENVQLTLDNIDWAKEQEEDPDIALIYQALKNSTDLCSGNVTT
jgi:hypothetical protein